MCRFHKCGDCIHLQIASCITTASLVGMAVGIYGFDKIGNIRKQ